MRSERVLYTVAFLLVLIVNILLVNWDVHWDLTSDKRFSLSQSAKNILSSGEDPLVITVLLEGNLPANLRSYREYIDHYLREVRRLRPDVTILARNPASGSLEEVNSFRLFLDKQGIKPMSRRVASKDEIKTSLIYPFLTVHNSRHIRFVDLLEPLPGDQNEEEAMLNSMAQFESKLIRAIRDVESEGSSRVLILGSEKDFLAQALLRKPQSFPGLSFATPNQVDPWRSIDTLDALLMVDKGMSLDREDLLFVDQCLMHGIPVLWLLDRYAVSIDSIRRYGSYVAIPGEGMLDDFMFRHGVKLSPSLLMDLRATNIPQVIGETGGQPRIISVPYPYHILVDPNKGPNRLRCTKPINMRFVTPIDTIRTSNPISKEIILTSSGRSKTVPPPVELNFNFLRIEHEVKEYHSGEQQIGILLDGNFSSYFQNRLRTGEDERLTSAGLVFRNESPRNRQLIIPDTDFILPMIAENGQIFPLNYNRWDRQLYPGNIELLRNGLELLIHGENLLALNRSDIAIPQLDTIAYASNPFRFAIYLLVIPILVLLALPWGLNRYRRNRYERMKR